MSDLTRVDVLLLEGLALHRVLTTDQAAHVGHSARPTANHRLNRLRRLGLVDRARPYASSGSAPHHWWLTGQGRARVDVVGRPRDSASGRQQLVHTAAVAAVPLGIERHGPALGLTLLAWQREQRETWTTFGGRRSIQADGYALVEVTGEGMAVPLLVEVDRNTMSPTRLREKVYRYLDYAAYGAWQGTHAMCPVLLVLTTSDSRAEALVAAVARKRKGMLSPTGELLVAACGEAHQVDRAITEAVWRADHNGDGEAQRKRTCTLTEELVYRVSTERDGRFRSHRPWEDTP